MTQVPSNLIPTRITQLPMAPVADPNALMMIVYEGNNYLARVGDFVGVGVTSVAVSGGTTGLTTSGGPITTAGTITLAGTLVVANGGTGATNATAARANLSAAVLGANNDITSMTALAGGVGTPDYIDFDVAAAPASAVGRLAYDDGDGTLVVGLKGGNRTLPIGQENVVLAYNGSGSTISKGQVVSVNGAQGQRPRITLADADTEVLSAATLGVAAESIANGAEGFVATFGIVRGINTNGFTAGDAIYLSQTAGAFTATRPLAPAHTVFLGWVLKINAASGELFLNISNGWELDELHNVRITSIQNNDLLQYATSGPYWQNVASSSVSVGSATNIVGGIASQIPYQTGAGTTSFIANGAAGQVLTSNGTSAPSWNGIDGGTF